MSFLEEGGSVIPVAEVCRKHGISAPTYYPWKSKYAGMSLPELKRVRELKAENAKWKRMYAELALKNSAIKDVLSESSSPVSETIGSRCNGDRTSPLASSIKAWMFHSLEQAKEVIEDWREDYNGICGHESLGNRPLAAYLLRFVKTENSIYDLSTGRGSLRLDKTYRACK